MRLLDDDEGMGEVCLALLRGRALAINPNLFYARPTIAGLHLQFARTARTRREVAAQLREARAVLAEHVGRRPEDTDSGRLLDQLVKALEMFDDQTAQAP
ncbi:unnamed protein product [Prorocentrum cordatum]|uniref:Uncharacterized protein n=1 Tax=Prorocentrum cordatum TaxID=2364126 RepID=A0ABN9Q675_9DINO|nr:unnamed protein product [Polarella glacialis]